MRAPEPSLRARALRLLSNREYSRHELIRRLSPHSETPEQLEGLIVELESAGYLSNQRFAESLARRRGARYGVLRLARELGEHGLAPELRQQTLAMAAEQERATARQVWERKFGQLPSTIQERARQHRFLAARGFTGATIAWLLKGGIDEEGLC